MVIHASDFYVVAVLITLDTIIKTLQTFFQTPEFSGRKYESDIKIGYQPLDIHIVSL
jgi:hypothetical protein